MSASQVTQAAIMRSGVLWDVSSLALKDAAPTPTAQWNFAELGQPYLTTDGDLPLTRGTGTNVNRVTTPFGYGVRFTGSVALVLSAATAGSSRLNVGASTGKVTVAAWVNSGDTGTGYIAGCWQEDDNDPRRSYGLFESLAGYGGADRVNMHVGKLGGATPGYPYSRDLAASGDTITRGTWQLYAGTYDGEQAIAYLDGQATSYKAYTDPLGRTYDKNPYIFAQGLNATPCEFTVGACRLTSGLANWWVGDMARLRVWDRALTPQQIRALYLAEKP